MSGHLGNGPGGGEISLPDDPVDLEEISPADVLLALPETVPDEMAVTLTASGTSWDRLDRLRLSKTTPTICGLGHRTLVLRGQYGAVYRARTRPEIGDVGLDRLDSDTWSRDPELNTWSAAGIVTDLRVLEPKTYDHVYLYEQRVGEKRPWNDIQVDVDGRGEQAMSKFADRLGFHEYQSHSNSAYRALADADPDDFGTPFPGGEGSDA